MKRTRKEVSHAHPISSLAHARSDSEGKVARNTLRNFFQKLPETFAAGRRLS
jgi:hypothetical protein